MKNVIIYFFVSIGATLTFWSCKDKQIPVSLDGQEILHVKNDTVFTVEGNKMVLENTKKIYYLVRHAEKDTVPADNPGLTPAGLQRATRLADILRATRVDGIYSTLKTRTLYTVDSLADIKVMNIAPYDNKNLRKVIDEIRADSTKKSVVIVGHSNTIPSLVNSLAGRPVINKNFDENEYDRFIIVCEKTDGSVEVMLLHYNVQE